MSTVTRPFGRKGGWMLVMGGVGLEEGEGDEHLALVASFAHTSPTHRPRPCVRLAGSGAGVAHTSSKHCPHPVCNSQDTVLAWHTISIGKVAASGAMEHLTLGKKSFIVQLNAAGRALAAELGLLLVDYEAVTLGFHDSRYLMDSHHPTDKVSLEVMNLYLALLAQLPDVPLPHPGQCAGVRGLAAPADGVPTLL
eukprot:359702-Chlamydomonas_euryale.AAC.3